VTCAFAIFFLPAPESALREFCRVLRSGGTVALSSWSRADDYGWYRELRREFGVSVNLERGHSTPRMSSAPPSRRPASPTGA